MYAFNELTAADGGTYRCNYGTDNNVMTKLTVVDTKVTCPAAVGPVNSGEMLPGECSLKKQGSEPIDVKWKTTDIILKRCV